MRVEGETQHDLTQDVLVRICDPPSWLTPVHLGQIPQLTSHRADYCQVEGSSGFGLCESAAPALGPGTET